MKTLIKEIINTSDVAYHYGIYGLIYSHSHVIPEDIKKEYVELQKSLVNDDKISVGEYSKRIGDWILTRLQSLSKVEKAVLGYED